MKLEKLKKVSEQTKLNLIAEEKKQAGFSILTKNQSIMSRNLELFLIKEKFKLDHKNIVNSFINTVQGTDKSPDVLEELDDDLIDEYNEIVKMLDFSIPKIKLLLEKRISDVTMPNSNDMESVKKIIINNKVENLKGEASIKRYFIKNFDMTSSQSTALSLLMFEVYRDCRKFQLNQRFIEKLRETQMEPEAMNQIERSAIKFVNYDTDHSQINNDSQVSYTSKDKVPNSTNLINDSLGIRSQNQAIKNTSRYKDEINLSDRTESLQVNELISYRSKHSKNSIKAENLNRSDRKNQNQINTTLLADDSISKNVVLEKKIEKASSKDELEEMERAVVKIQRKYKSVKGNAILRQKKLDEKENKRKAEEEEEYFRKQEIKATLKIQKVYKTKKANAESKKKITENKSNAISNNINFIDTSVDNKEGVPEKVEENKIAHDLNDSMNKSNKLSARHKTENNHSGVKSSRKNDGDEVNDDFQDSFANETQTKVENPKNLHRKVTEEELNLVAVKIQSVFKGKRDRKMAKELKKLKEEKELENAAVKIQKVFKGKKDRKEFVIKKQQRKEEEAAAIKIQNVYRTRKQKSRESDNRASQENKTLPCKKIDLNCMMNDSKLHYCDTVKYEDSIAEETIQRSEDFKLDDQTIFDDQIGKSINSPVNEHKKSSQFNRVSKDNSDVNHNSESNAINYEHLIGEDEQKKSFSNISCTSNDKISVSSSGNNKPLPAMNKSNKKENKSKSVGKSNNNSKGVYGNLDTEFNNGAESKSKSPGNKTKTNFALTDTITIEPRTETHNQNVVQQTNESTAKKGEIESSKKKSLFYDQKAEDSKLNRKSFNDSSVKDQHEANQILQKDTYDKSQYNSDSKINQLGFYPKDNQIDYKCISQSMLKDIYKSAIGGLQTNKTPKSLLGNQNIEQINEKSQNNAKREKSEHEKMATPSKSKKSRNKKLSSSSKKSKSNSSVSSKSDKSSNKSKSDSSLSDIKSVKRSRSSENNHVYSGDKAKTDSKVFSRSEQKCSENDLASDFDTSSFTDK